MSSGGYTLRSCPEYILLHLRKIYWPAVALKVSPEMPDPITTDGQMWDGSRIPEVELPREVCVLCVRDEEKWGFRGLLFLENCRRCCFNSLTGIGTLMSRCVSELFLLLFQIVTEPGKPAGFCSRDG